MKFYKLIIFILIVFFKTGTLFSENNLFNVNNIELVKKDKTSNSILADKAIKKGFNQLLSKILLKEDIGKLSNLNFATIKDLVAYYQISEGIDKEKQEEIVNFSITFDKDKTHDLFFKKAISYSEISDKELYVLPVLIKDNEIFIFNNNFFYKNWNEIYIEDLIEFILPLENIEIIKNINNNDNLIDLNLNDVFKEYSKKNLALILIEDNTKDKVKIYIKSKIQGKLISKSINLKKQISKDPKFYEKIIIEIKKELVDLVKSKNLIDIRTPSFLNVKFELDKKKVIWLN